MVLLRSAQDVGLLVLQVVYGLIFLSLPLQCSGRLS